MEHLEDVVKENGWSSIDDAYYNLMLTPYMGLIQQAAERFELELKQLNNNE